MLYRLPKPRPDGTQHIELGVHDLLDRLSQLLPPPRRHRHRYHGVLAPNALMRPAVTARAAQPSSRAAEQPSIVRPGSKA